ncbi:hypothetical protein [Aquimarina algiphila]|uniref:Uncharacterized protein n=1 Tax=Aquimarina algiphila TaxID=2047982 RepID=A0A554VND2_9FLAO|nr:hypothetical protein [Aquimarina algiphila]TSE09852.1 hypothetical protein FOF46_07505 [Aquimarina algiphila]
MQNKNNEEDIKKAINLIIENDVEYDDLIEFFIDNDIDYKIVEDLFIFLPIIFCRIMLPQVNFPDTFIEMKDNNETRKVFKSMPIYNLIYKTVEEYIKMLSGQDIIKIAGLSAEFKVISDLLIKEGEDDENLLKEIKLTEMVINR